MGNIVAIETKSRFKSGLALFQAASPACTELETIVLDWLGESVY